MNEKMWNYTEKNNCSRGEKQAHYLQVFQHSTNIRKKLIIFSLRPLLNILLNTGTTDEVFKQSDLQTNKILSGIYW